MPSSHQPDNANLPAPYQPPNQQVVYGFPQAGVAYPPAPYSFDQEPEEQSVPLRHYFWILRRHRWRIAGFVTAVTLATLIISSRLTPIYESTATIDVDRRQSSAVIGQEANQGLISNDADQFLATQLKLIQSDSVLRPVVQRFNLIDYEEITRDTKPVPGVEVQEAPVLLKNLKVTRPPNTYLLLIAYRSEDPKLAADVANAIADSYLRHTYDIRAKSSAALASYMEKQLQELRARMERSSAALAAFERELNVINPEEKTSILSARLLQFNQEYTTAQSERVRKQAAWESIKSGSLEAALVSPQGDALRRLLDQRNEAEQRYSLVRAQYGANHPEYRKASSQLTELDRLLDATRNQIVQRVKVEYDEALAREQMLERQVAETKKEFDTLNARSFDYQRLKQEAEADKKLFEELNRKIQEAGINSSFQNSAIRLADPARPSIKPVFPNIKLNVLLAFLFSTILAVGAAVLSDVLDTTIRDPEMVSRALNTDVIGTLPVVKTWKRGSLAGLNAPSASPSTALTLASPAGAPSDDSHRGFEEAIRTLRNSILLADFDRRIRTIMVTSASPGEGKSTIAANLAVAHAQQEHRTLIIDGDVRRPSIHRRFNIENRRGLSSLLEPQPDVNRYSPVRHQSPAADFENNKQDSRNLTGLRNCPGNDWRSYLQTLEGLANLHILTAGPVARRAADLVGRKITEILEDADEYDLIVVDSPPLLGFAEPLQMATAVDGVLVVSRAGQTNRKAVGSVLQTLQRLRANVLGLVLNEVTKDLSDNYYYYGYYGKYYKYYKRPEPEESPVTTDNA